MLLLVKTLLLLTAPACQHSPPSYQASANSTSQLQPLTPLCPNQDMHQLARCQWCEQAP